MFLLFTCTVLAFMFFFPGCNAIENLTNSGSKLVIVKITGNDIEGNEDSTIAFSDVVTSSGTIFNDNGQLTAKTVLLDPLATSPTFYQDVIIDQVDVEYSRSNGLNVQGRDVPFSFSQKVTFRVAVNETLKFSFVLIQHTAKMEEPLVDLRDSGEEIVIKLEVKLTFHGKDLAGRRVEPAVGYISVWCANFADTK